MRSIFIFTSVALIVSGCAANRNATPDAPVAEEGEETTHGDHATTDDGTPLLQVKVTDQTSDGRVMLMRGKLTNPTAETVEGVRMILLMGNTRGDGTYRITDVQRKELGSTIAPGKSTMFRWDVESQSNAGPGRFAVIAVPKRLGGRDIPPPKEWTENPSGE